MLAINFPLFVVNTDKDESFKSGVLFNKKSEQFIMRNLFLEVTNQSPNGPTNDLKIRVSKGENEENSP